MAASSGTSARTTAAPVGCGDMELCEWLRCTYEALAEREAVWCNPGLLVGLLAGRPAPDMGQLEGFIARFRDRLREIYSAYRDDPFAPPLLSCPESLIVFERLTNDRFLLRENWPLPLTGDDYRRLAVTWGVSTGHPW